MMKSRLFGSVAALAFAAAAAAQTAAIPHLEKRGAATQLIVDGRPFLALAGELANTASSSPEYMAPVWPRLARMNLNTVLVGVSWALVEPAEGKYDFSLVDGALTAARNNHLHVILIWFGSWKNGISSFAPVWVKTDQDRFPRVQVAGGQSLEVLTTLSPANRDADARAYAAFLRHLRAVDGAQHTAIMLQLENEVGILGDTRDRSPAADAAYAGPVPEALTDYLTAHRGQLRPELRHAWEAAGAKTTGTWEQVFGASPPASPPPLKNVGLTTDEIFMAWNYSRYMGAVAAAGKAEYALPVFTNTWIIQPEDKVPGDYPSGGPEAHVLDVWRAGGPAIDINAPDIYLPNFTEWVARFHQNGNPLFVPESRGDAGGVANAFYAIGRHLAIGYSPFGIDGNGRLRPGAAPAAPVEASAQPLAKGYAVLQALAPIILEAQAKGTISAASLTATGRQTEDLALGDYTVTVDLRRNLRNPADVPPFGYALVIATGPGEYLVAGYDVQVTFAPNTPGPPIAGLARVEAGRVVDGRWVAGRILNGDDILLNYHLGQAAAVNQSGSGLKFMEDGPTLQQVQLYRYH